MDIDSTFKEHYFWELQRRDRLNSSLAFPVGIVTLLFGAIYAILQVVSLDMEGWNAVLLLFLLVTIILLSFGVFFLIRAYWGYTYKHMPFSEKLLIYKEKLVVFHEDSGKNHTDALKAAECDFAADLNCEYAKNSELNEENNDSKSSNIFRANLFIIASIVFMALCGLVFLWQTKHAPVPAIKVEITNLKEFVMTNDKKPTDPPTKPTRNPEPIRPTMPPSRDVKEHVDPKKRP